MLRGIFPLCCSFSLFCQENFKFIVTTFPLLERIVLFQKTQSFHSEGSVREDGNLSWVELADSGDFGDV